jgi:hypothetical protein
MPLVGFVLTAFLIAACSGPGNGAAHHHDHPASPDAPAAAHAAAEDSLPTAPAPAGHDHAADAHADHHDATPLAADEMGAILSAYFPIAAMLAEDSTEGLDAAGARLAEALRAAADRHQGHEALAQILPHAESLAAAATLEEARGHFGMMSPTLARLADASETPAGMEVYRLVCGMADAPEGGVWLQDHDQVRNPYFGSAMLRCARTVESVTEHADH